MSIITSNGKIVRIENKVLYIPPPSLGQGTLITMNLDGTDRLYRVLKNIGNGVHEVFSMQDVLYGNQFDSKQTQIYSGGDLDIALNTTWYNKLSTEAKAAIIPKNITQDAWYYGTSGHPQYSGTWGTAVPGDSSYTISLAATDFAAIGERYIYAMSIQEILDYLSDSSVLVDTSAMLRNQNFWQMFWNTSAQSSNGEYFWLRSADASVSNQAWMMHDGVGRPAPEVVYSACGARPTFQIDLTKIPYTISN